MHTRGRETYQYREVASEEPYVHVFGIPHFFIVKKCRGLVVGERERLCFEHIVETLGEGQ